MPNPGTIPLLFVLALSLGQMPAGRAGSPPAVGPMGMVRVPTGVYRPSFRGANALKEIQVKAFYLDVYPVTNGEFLEFIRANPGWRRSQVKCFFADQDYLKNWVDDLDPGPDVATNAPVTRVSWFVAKAYAEWKGKRLPTTAEWEYAAAAGPTRPDGGNDSEFQQRVLRWYATPAPTKLAPVGTGQLNFWGAGDMHGLIWEWVADFDSARAMSEVRDDNGLESDLFCGSGSQGAKDAGNYPAFMRYGFRSSLKAEYCVHNLGFRCAKDL